MRMIRLPGVDGGKGFDFGKTSKDYARYRDIYPESFYQTLHGYNIGTAGQRVLDLGTGTGVVPRSMVKYGANWTAADISEEQIAMAKEITEDENIGYIVCPADDIPAPDDTFDAVTACQCFWYFPKETSIPEIRRVLKPGGRFAVIMMIHLPKESEIARKSEEMVLKYNPQWTGGGYDRIKLEEPDWPGNHFKVAELHEYVEDVRFTREGWCGRMKSCRGVGASLPPETVERYYQELYASLCETESFMIPHQMIYEIYDVIK